MAPTLTSFAAPMGHAVARSGPWGVASLGAARREA